MEEAKNVISRLEAKHWVIIAMFLSATASVISGLDHWQDLLTPGVLGGLLGQLATVITSVFVGAPTKPDSDQK